jgi:hypothetical protein
MFVLVGVNDKHKRQQQMNWRFIMATYPNPHPSQQKDIVEMVQKLAIAMNDLSIKVNTASTHCRHYNWTRTAEQLNKLVSDLDHRTQMLFHAVDADCLAVSQYSDFQAVEERIEF